MIHAERLNKVSTAFFFLGFTTARMQHLPIPFIAPVSTLGSLIFYAIGYFLWELASERYASNPVLPKYWYGFSQFKDQYKTASILGGLALVCCLVGILFPVALVVAAWIFTLSNVFWSIAEYHKLKAPPAEEEEKFSTRNQSYYFKYVACVTLITLVTTITTTLAFIFPPAALLIAAIAVVTSLFLSGFAMHFWTECTLNKVPPDKVLNNLSEEDSYKKMMTNVRRQEKTSELEPEAQKDGKHSVLFERHLMTCSQSPTEPAPSHPEQSEGPPKSNRI